MNFENIHNYYEQLVFRHLREKLAQEAADQDFLEDVACLALNRLPARYVRYDVDTAFFMSEDDQLAMEAQVAQAVAAAIAFVNEHRGAHAAVP